MTRERAIKALKWFKEYNEDDYGAGDRIIDKYGDCYYLVTERDFEAFDMAIKALEQEPILDKVKQAREEIENLNLNDYGDNLYQFQAKCTEILDKLIESEG